MHQRRFGRLGWSVSEIGYGMWGMGGWTGSDDEESLARARPRGRTGLQFLRHGVGLRRRPAASSCSARRCSAHAGTRLYVATKVPPKNLQVAGQRADARSPRSSPTTTSCEMTEKSLRQPRRRRASTCSSSTCGATRGSTTTAGSARSTTSSAKGLIDGLRHQRQPLGADQRPEGARHRARRRGAGRLQHLRPGARRRAVPCLPAAGRRGHRARAVRRRQPHRHADAGHDVAGGRLAQPLLHAGDTSPRRCSASRR